MNGKVLLKMNMYLDALTRQRYSGNETFRSVVLEYSIMQMDATTHFEETAEVDIYHAR